MFVLFGITSCTPDVEEHMHLNGKEYPSNAREPEDDIDLIKVMADADRHRIIVVDKSSPAGDVGSRVWLLKNKFGDVVRAVTDSSSIRLLLPTAGLFSLNLTVNGDAEGSITNWIKVEGEVEDIVLNSSVGFITPSRTFQVTNDRVYSVLLKASIWPEDLDYIDIQHNGKSVPKSDYEFDETEEQIAFTVRLKEGENTLRVSGVVEDEDIDVSRTIEYTKETSKSGSALVAQNGGQSNSSTEEEEAPARPEEPLSGQTEPEINSDLADDTRELEEQAATDQAEIDRLADEAKKLRIAEDARLAAERAEAEEDEEEDNAPTKTFDVGYKLKSLSAYNQEKLLGIKVVQLSELSGDCALQFGHGSFVVDITEVKDIMYVKSLKLAQNPELQGTDITIKLECLNTDRTGQPRRSEDAVVGYTENEAMTISLTKLNKMPLLPGNKYRLTIMCEPNTELGFVDANKCSGKIDKSDIVKLDYKDGKCPLFSLKLKH